VAINSAAVLDVQPSLMVTVNSVEESAESHLRLNSALEMEVDSASKVESTLKENLTCSSKVSKFVPD
jgi:hypothetical protein